MTPNFGFAKKAGEKLEEEEGICMIYAHDIKNCRQSTFVTFLCLLSLACGNQV